MIMRNSLLGLGAALAVALSGVSSSPASAEGLATPSRAVQVAESKEVKLYRRLIAVEDGGKMVTFKGPKQETVKAKVSSKRTKLYFSKKEKGLKKVMKDGKMAKASALKAGNICTITYVEGGDNEPKEMACFAE